MRIIRQSGTEERDVYTVNVKERDSGQDIGCIQISTRTRTTEKEALQSPYIPNKDPDTIIKERKPYPDAVFCGMCGWRPANRFNKNRSRPTGYEGYCKDCRRKIRSTTIWQQESSAE